MLKRVKNQLKQKLKHRNRGKIIETKERFLIELLLLSKL